MKKQKYWFGVMDFQGYELHVVSATKREAEGIADAMAEQWG